MFYIVEIDTVYNTPERIVGISTNRKELEDRCFSFNEKVKKLNYLRYETREIVQSVASKM